jgi:hypothetical protein
LNEEIGRAVNKRRRRRRSGSSKKKSMEKGYFNEKWFLCRKLVEPTTTTAAFT